MSNLVLTYCMIYSHSRSIRFVGPPPWRYTITRFSPIYMHFPCLAFCIIIIIISFIIRIKILAGDNADGFNSDEFINLLFQEAAEDNGLRYTNTRTVKCQIWIHNLESQKYRDIPCYSASLYRLNRSLTRNQSNGFGPRSFCASVCNSQQNHLVPWSPRHTSRPAQSIFTIATPVPPL